MTTSISLNALDHNQASRDEDKVDVPILCETCLGPNPLVQMIKSINYRACKICERGFNVFRWKPGRDSRYKKTEICKTCAKAKNVCQTCLFDLQYGLPVQVRDSVLAQNERVDMAQGDVKSRSSMVAALEAKLGDDGVLEQYSRSNPVLEKLARRDPYYERNKAKLCSFYARGACNRGDLCPYRHEMPKEENELSKQNILDRYHGTNDPVAAKILRKATQKTNDLLPPDDQTITTLFLGNIPDSATENRIRSTFESYGSITNVHVVPSKNVAFVTFARRGSAEEAINQLAGVMTMDGQLIRMAWGKRSSNSGGSSNNISISSTNPVLSDLALKAASTAAANTGDFSSLPKAPPPPGMTPHQYSSMSSTYHAASTASHHPASATTFVPPPPSSYSSAHSSLSRPPPPPPPGLPPKS